MELLAADLVRKSKTSFQFAISSEYIAGIVVIGDRKWLSPIKTKTKGRPS